MNTNADINPGAAGMDTTTDVRVESSDPVAAAITAFRNGDPVLVHDFTDREGETDIIYPAHAVDADAIAHLRNDAGGLICTAVSDAVATTLELPFLEDVFEHPAAADHELGYDSRSSFSLPVNHRETFTGITDDDRATTIQRLGTVAAAAAAGEYTAEDFAAEFRTPGHVNILRGAPGLLTDRRGHTELGLALADAADCAPAVVVCEMLDDTTGNATAPADAETYAAENNIVFIHGAALVEELSED